ncbi:hypothetical protein D1BOALGB6SA_10607 [Olavius sp. associated proteobacterium Delta 1]|nr:hypothetical protein D1BOALGB6SA_10607 [Olavius sp. associated proteobacterium Delta 1]
MVLVFSYLGFSAVSMTLSGKLGSHLPMVSLDYVRTSSPVIFVIFTSYPLLHGGSHYQRGDDYTGC